MRPANLALSSVSSQHAANAETGMQMAWHMPARTARTLRVQRDGVLRVSTGLVWATLDPLPSSPHAEAADHFVAPGQALLLKAGQRVVLEAWPDELGQLTTLSWSDASPGQAPAPVQSQWQTQVSLPAHTLAQALGVVACSSAQLLLGLIRCALAPADAMRLLLRRSTL